MKFVEVVLPLPLDGLFTYSVAEKQVARAAVYSRNHQDSRQEKRDHYDTGAYNAVSQSASQPVVSSAVSSSEPLNTQHYQDMAMGTQQIKSPM